MRLIRKHLIIDDRAPRLACHAPTLLRLQDGTLLAAWFAGEREGTADVTIWCSRYSGGAWSIPRPVAPEQGVPHWNPVLFQMDSQTVWLFYKIGFEFDSWQTYVITSADGGETWSQPRPLVENDTSGGRGPVKNKPIRLSNGRILAPGSTEQGVWRGFVDVSDDGTHWEKKSIPVVGDGAENIHMIQPTLWESAPGHVHAMMRSKQTAIYRSDSADGGETWCPAYPTNTINNNSGIDCVALSDGTVVLVCNPTNSDRFPLSLFISQDNGITFAKVLDLETGYGEFSYPAIIAHGNRLYVAYTYKRENIALCELEIE